MRLISTGHGRKSDQADALSVGIAAWSAPALRTRGDRRGDRRAASGDRTPDDLVHARTQLINRLHALLVKLVPSGLARGLTAEAAAATPRPVSGTTLTELLGIGDVVAAKILAHTGPITRFPSPATVASFCGVAPIEVSSGDVARHRLSRAGDRQLNYALHVMALAQIRYDSPGHSYYPRKRAAGKSHKEATRCLKRRQSESSSAP